MGNQHNSIIPILAACATAVYAVLDGFHTLSDFDVWWQLASGRWMWTHGEILRQETFSHTAAGHPWIYPGGGELLFYWLYRQGGAALLSLLAPAACLVIAALLVRGGGLLRAWTVALAAPLVAWRANVRADMFTTVFAAIFVVSLWGNHRDGREARGWLWILPPLMALWANLHPGFLLGLALLGVFAMRHPRRIAPVALAGAIATLLNPWGWRIYSWVPTLANLLPLPQSMQAWAGNTPAYGNAFIGEFSPTPFSSAALGDALRWRDPDSAFWWLMAVGLIAVVIGLSRRQGWGPLLLIGAAAGALSTSRFQAVFAICVAVLAPDLLASRDPRESGQRGAWLSAASAALLLLFVGVRIADLAGNRYYMTHGELASFGTGVSGWFPERAVKFVRENHLPREIYNDYNEGGFLTWSLAPDYPVFIDGRGDPFGSELFFQQRRLGWQGPQSADWQAAIAKWKIRTLLISVSRFGGYVGLPIKTFCDSGPFRLAYLDETAAVFVLSGAGTGESKTPALDCRTVALAPPPATASAWDRYQFYANAGKLYYALERDAEADQAWQQAAAIFPGDPSLHLDFGQLRQAQGRPAEAEREFRTAIQLRPTPISYYALANLLAREGRPHEAMEYFRESAERDAHPHEAWAEMARSALAAQRPLIAIDAANRALEKSPFQGPAAVGDRGFVARTLALLADAYRLAGRSDDARRSLEEAKKLGVKGDVVDRLEKELGKAPKPAK